MIVRSRRAEVPPSTGIELPAVGVDTDDLHVEVVGIARGNQCGGSRIQAPFSDSRRGTRHPVTAEEEEPCRRDGVGKKLERRLRIDRKAVHLQHVWLTRSGREHASRRDGREGSEREEASSVDRHG